VFESLIMAWQDNTLEPEHLGLSSDHYFARDDIVAGEPDSFQNELLTGIDFLKDRMVRSNAREDDAINKVADTIWNAANAVFSVMSMYFNY
jgi:hypothetical protein